jgi:hypothetical protein
MSKPHEGFLLIADITGYTLYLKQSEIERVALNNTGRSNVCANVS